MNIYVSIQYGNDMWSGRFCEPYHKNDGPFKTIEAAKDKVRSLICEGIKEDIFVFIREGVYLMKEPLRFCHRDSHFDNYSVTYKNYQNEKAVISGAVKAENWMPLGNGVYKTKLSAEDKITSVYENGARCRIARIPNNGYFKTAEMDYEEKQRGFKFQSTDIQNTKYKSGIQAFIWPGGPDGSWNWFSEIIDIKSIDNKNNSIKLENSARFELGAGSRYFLQGSIDFLDSPGEFWFDENEGYLYYMPYACPIEEQDISVCITKRLIEIKGESEENPVSGISFEGLEFKHTSALDSWQRDAEEDGAIYLQNARNITVRNCRITQIGCHGIYIYGYAKDNVIYGNEITDIGYTALQLTGMEQTKKYTNCFNRLMNNYIKGAGKCIGHGAGISIWSSGDNVVSHNKIEDTSRYAISIKGIQPGITVGKIIEGEVITRENHPKFNHSRNNIISYNDLSNANTDSMDTGVIESWCPGENNVIHNNFIHDSDIHFSMGFGIYLDDASNHCTVTNNLVCHLQEKGEGTLDFAIFAKGIHNRIYNNIVAHNYCCAPIGMMEMANEPNRHLSILNNIFSNTGDYIFGVLNWTNDRVNTSDCNLFFNKKGNYKIFKRNSKEYIELQNSIDPDIILAAENLEEWRCETGFDIRSQTGDPCFMNTHRYDYRLRYDSPAIMLGFHEIDFMSAGLIEDYPFANKDDEYERLYVLAENSQSCIYLNRGGECKTEIKARTVNGYLVSPPNKEIICRIEDESIACMDNNILRGYHRGITKLVVKAKSAQTYVYVIVK